MNSGNCSGISGGQPADSRRQRQPYSDKGMVSNQNDRLSIPESRKRSRLAERIKIHARMGDYEALNGCSETGSETKQVGSGMNGRQRSGAGFRTPVECATV